jgi:DNA-binding HxlR family transcriptional regulator
MKYHDIKEPIRKFNEILGGKWRLLIVEQLIEGTQRFTEIQQSIVGITPRMLTKEIRSLTNYGIVQKEVFREMPPRVEYTLTNYGIKLLPLLEHIRSFGTNYTENEEDILNEKEVELVDELRLPTTQYIAPVAPKAVVPKEESMPQEKKPKEKAPAKPKPEKKISEATQEPFQQLSLF